MSKKRIIAIIVLLGIGIFFLFFHGIEIISDYIAYQSTTVSLFPPEVTTDDRGVAIFAICLGSAITIFIEPIVRVWIEEWMRKKLKNREKKKKRGKR